MQSVFFLLLLVLYDIVCGIPFYYVRYLVEACILPIQRTIKKNQHELFGRPSCAEEIIKWKSSLLWHIANIQQRRPHTASNLLNFYFLCEFSLFLCHRMAFIWKINKIYLFCYQIFLYAHIMTYMISLVGFSVECATRQACTICRVLFTVCITRSMPTLNDKRTSPKQNNKNQITITRTLYSI